MDADERSAASGLRRRLAVASRNQRRIATKNTKMHKKNYLATDETRIELTKNWRQKYAHRVKDLNV